MPLHPDFESRFQNQLRCWHHFQDARRQPERFGDLVAAWLTLEDAREATRAVAP